MLRFSCLAHEYQFLCHFSSIYSACFIIIILCIYSKTCVKPPLSRRPKIRCHDQLLLNSGQKYCRMLQAEHSAILLTLIKLPLVIKIFIHVLSIIEWLNCICSVYRSCSIYCMLHIICMLSSGREYSTYNVQCMAYKAV